MIKKLFHSVAHLFNWNSGNPESFWEGDKLMMSFRCSGCGERQSIHEITDKLSDWEKGKF